MSESSFSPLCSKGKSLISKKKRTGGNEIKLTHTLDCKVIAWQYFLSEKAGLHMYDVSGFLEVYLWQMWSALDIFFFFLSWAWLFCIKSLLMNLICFDTSENSQLLVTESKAGHNHNWGFFVFVFLNLLCKIKVIYNLSPFFKIYCSWIFSCWERTVILLRKIYVINNYFDCYIFFTHILF